MMYKNTQLNLMMRTFVVGTRKMHKDEVDTDSALVRRLIDVQFPQWSKLPIKPVQSAGTSYALYRLGEEMVVRLPRTAYSSVQVDKEQRWLPKLAPLLPLAIPYPIVAGIPAEGYPFPWSVYPWLEGEDASLTSVVDERQAAIDIGEFVKVLHQIDPKGGPLPGEHNFYRGVPLAMRDREVRSMISSLHGKFDTDLMVKVWNSSLEAPVWDDPPCWIHGDLIPPNLLVQKGRLSAVIDFGGLGVGDPACDLLVAWSLLSVETRDVFRSTLGVDDAAWTRGRGWALSLGVIAFEYYIETNPVLSRIAKYMIDETVADYIDRS
jgi:aminoglycoside phosphotransferase (APT) family kinase protein